MRTDNLNSDPILFFDRTCHKAQSHATRHQAIDIHICLVQPSKFMHQNIAPKNIYVALVLIIQQARQKNKVKNAASSKTQKSD